MKSNNDMAAGTYFEYFYSPKNRGQKYPLQGMTGFNQVVIKLQLILTITICDYDEE